MKDLRDLKDLTIHDVKPIVPEEHWGVPTDKVTDSARNGTKIPSQPAVWSAVWVVNTVVFRLSREKRTDGCN